MTRRDCKAAGHKKRRGHRAAPGPARDREHAVLPSFAGAVHHARLYASRKRAAGAALCGYCTPNAN